MTIPDLNGLVCVSWKDSFWTSSLNSRLPFPSTTGCNMNRYRSITFSCISVLKSCALPESRRSLPGSSLNLRTSAARSPWTSLEPGHSTLSSVEETTYLGMLFIFSANPASSVMDGQAAANPSYVLRPSSKASLACSSASLNSAASSLKKGPDQWPGSSKTPSSDKYSVATTRIFTSYQSGPGGEDPSSPSAVDGHRLAIHVRRTGYGQFDMSREDGCRSCQTTRTAAPYSLGLRMIPLVGHVHPAGPA